MTILEYIVEHFPIRRTQNQKAAFRIWASSCITERGYRPRVEESDKGKHKNIVAGNPDTAQVIFTAHYDTPGCIGLPNLMIPRNWPVYFLYQAFIVLVLLSIAFLGGMAFAALTGKPDMLRVGLLLTYFLLLGFMLYGPANKHNVNDNTSGVSTLLQLMEKVPPALRSQVAFILFDNEEKGCRGSKAFAREHLQVQHTKLVVNLDCVGVGDHIIFSVPKLARNMPQYELLESVLAGREGRTVHFFSAATTRGSSDHRSFKCGVGVSAYQQTAGVGFITGAIHTWRDTEADQENLDFLAEALGEYVEKLDDPVKD